MRSDLRSRPAVTGLGFVSPLGHDPGAVWDAFAAGRSMPVQHEHRLDGERWGRFPVFRVEGFDPRRLPWGMPSRAYADAHDLWEDTDLMLLAGAALRALADAGFDPASPPADLALVLAHENPGLDRHVDTLLESFHERPATDSRRAAADALYATQRERVYEMQTFMPLHRTARLLGAHGHGLFVNNACASGLYALDAAALLLEAGRARTVVVAAADHPLSYAKYRWFAEQGLVAEDGVAQPFDRDRHGFVLGDGGAALVLELPAEASARGVRPYAAYRGGGFTQEGWKVTVPDPASKHYARALGAALDDAALAPADLDWIVAHGAATSVADAYEARTLNAVFGSAFERPRLAAFKPFIGHNLGGSGLQESALLLLALQHGFLPAVRGCETPDPALGLQPLVRPAVESARFAMKCAAGFGGFDAACVFENLERGA